MNNRNKFYPILRCGEDDLERSILTKINASGWIIALGISLGWRFNNNQWIMYNNISVMLSFIIICFFLLFQIEWERFKCILFSWFSLLYLIFLIFYLSFSDLSAQLQFLNGGVFASLIKLRSALDEFFCLIFYYMLFLFGASIKRKYLFFLKLFSFFFLFSNVVYGFISVYVWHNGIHNMNYYSYIVYLTIVATLVLLNEKDFVLRLICIIILFVILISFQSRLAIFSSAVLMIIYFLYPVIAQHSGRSLTLYFLTIFVLLIFTWAYTLLPETELYREIDDVSLSMTGKGAFGRVFIWKDLVKIIIKNPLFGYCTNCSSELYYGELANRNLSAHNAYLEYLRRGGLVLLAIILGIVYSLLGLITNDDYENKRVLYAVLISASIMSFGYEFIFFSILVPNVLLWSLLGLLGNVSGKIVKKNTSIQIT